MRVCEQGTGCRCNRSCVSRKGRNGTEAEAIRPSKKEQFLAGAAAAAASRAAEGGEAGETQPSVERA